MNKKEVLGKIIAFYEGESDNWTQYYAAKNKDGILTGVHYPDACSWCIYGAFVRFIPKPSDAMKIMYDIMGYDMISWNDEHGRTKEQILIRLRSTYELME